MNITRTLKSVFFFILKFGKILKTTQIFLCIFIHYNKLSAQKMHIFIFRPL